MELAIPVLGVLVTLLTVAFALCLCFAGGCCPTLKQCRENRRRNSLLGRCRKVRYSEQSKCCANENCPICLEDFKFREKIIVSPCRHGYHRNCIVDCLERSPQCPVCKATICDDREDTERTPLL